MTVSKTKAAAGKKPAASSAKKVVSKAEAPSTSTNEVSEEVEKVDQAIAGNVGPTVVIPFLAKASRGNELQFAVRAWTKHLPNCRIIVIGDAMPWFGKDIIHIPHKPTQDNPQIDVAHKLMAAIASEEVPDFFILSNDDIYPVANLTISEIDVLKANGRLTSRGAPGSTYAKNTENTLKALRKVGIENPYDFATHTPVTIHKNELAETIQQFECDKVGHLIYSLYANTFFIGHRPIITDNGAGGSIVASVFRANPNLEVLGRAFDERKFINHNDAGWTAVIPFLKERFGEKCRFEK